MSMKNVMSGFRVCGICPFNREVLTKPEEQYSSFKPEALPQLSGLKYIPLYSPARVRTKSIRSSLSPTGSTKKISTPIKCGFDILDSTTFNFSTSRQYSYSESNLHNISLDQSSNESKCLIPLQRAGSLSQFLITPTPPSRAITKQLPIIHILSENTDNINDGLLSWIGSLALTKQDENILLSGGWLSANHVSAVHKFLRKRFPTQEGLNDTSILSEKLYWPSRPEKCVQIIHVSGCHWACLSNRFCGDGEIDLYDCYHTIPAQNDGILKQACTILHSQKSSVS